jgi:hypothetical protein
MRTRERLLTRGGWLVVVLTVLVLAGCASAPLPPARQLQAADLNRLGGTWVWTAASDTPARLGTGPIKVKVAGGQMVFESAWADGTLTLHEDAKRRVLNGEGRDKFTGRRFPVQLTHYLSAEERRQAEATPGIALVLVVTE